MFSPQFLFRIPLVLLTTLALTASACSGKQQTPDTHPAAEQAAPHPDARLQSAELLSTHAQWMPADTVAVLIGSPHALWEIAHNVFPTAERGGDTHFEAFQKDISQLLLPHIGVDIRQVDSVILAIGLSRQVLILAGDLDMEYLNKHQPAPAKGYIAYQFQPGLLGESQNSLWGVPLENQQGIAIFLTPDAASQAIQAVASASNTLASTPALFNSFQNLLEATTSNDLVLAGHLDEAMQQTLTALTSMPAPRTLVLDYGDSALRAHLQGQPEALDHYEHIFNFYRYDMPENLRALYNTGGLDTPYARASFISGYHLAMSLAAALKFERTPETLAVDIALPRQNVLMLLGVAAASAIPAYEKYIARSKASEAQIVFSQLSAEAIAYYEQSAAQGGTCHFPPSANPVPAHEPCCDDIGPTGGERWQAPADTWQQPGWQALNVQITDPRYFAYQTIHQPGKDGAPDTFILRAFADFKLGGPRHTTELHITGQQNPDGTCHARAYEPITHNELQ